MARRRECDAISRYEAKASRFAFGIEHGRLAKQPLKARLTARRRIERGDKSVPSLAIEREGPPVGKPLLGLAERGVEHEFADGLACGGCSGLQGLFGGAAQPKIELFRPIGASGHFAS